MRYFSAKATWLSLLEDNSANPAPQDWGSAPPEVLAPGAHFEVAYPGRGSAAGDEEEAENLEKLRDLRHRLFFQHGEWEYGPQLLRDNLALARRQSDKEEALAHYCRARHVAECLVRRHRHTRVLMAWLEIDLVVAEILLLSGDDDASAMYAREGLALIKSNRFPSGLDPVVTRLAIRFLRLLERR